MKQSLQSHWPEYLIEGALLGIFMIAAASVTALLEHPSSPAFGLITNPNLRRAVIGFAMGVTAVALIYSPWGQRSGAHMNPATTLSFLRLGKIQRADAFLYVAAQFAGGACGILLFKLFMPGVIAHPSVQYVVTVPGTSGAAIAFLAETIISCGMMLMVLFATNSRRYSDYAGWFAGSLVFLYITFEAPLSGMSINPARTFASAFPSGVWTAGWIYFIAPPLGMFLAVEAFSAFKQAFACPKYFHGTSQRCIFCGFPGKRVASAHCKVGAPAATH